MEDSRRDCCDVIGARHGDDIWIAVRLPGEYEGEDRQVIKQWTTVVLGEDELTWLKEAFAAQRHR